MAVPVPRTYESLANGLSKPMLRLVRDTMDPSDENPEPGQSGCVLKPWVQKLTYKEQRTLMSAFRGSDQTTDKNVKMVIRMIRREAQADDSNDGGEHYLGEDDVAEIAKHLDIRQLRDELEHRSVHLFQHIMEALYVCQRERGKPFLEPYEYLLEKVVAPMWGFGAGP